MTDRAASSRSTLAPSARGGVGDRSARAAARRRLGRRRRDAGSASRPRPPRSTSRARRSTSTSTSAASGSPSSSTSTAGRGSSVLPRRVAAASSTSGDAATCSGDGGGVGLVGASSSATSGLARSTSASVCSSASSAENARSSSSSTSADGRSSAGQLRPRRAPRRVVASSRSPVAEPDEAHLAAQLVARSPRRPAARTSSITARTSAAVPPSDAWTKLACFSDTQAVPMRWPRRPRPSTRLPALTSPGTGLTNTEPQF